jgi:hypothetical protein
MSDTNFIKIEFNMFFVPSDFSYCALFASLIFQALLNCYLDSVPWNNLPAYAYTYFSAFFARTRFVLIFKYLQCFSFLRIVKPAVAPVNKVKPAIFHVFNKGMR